MTDMQARIVKLRGIIELNRFSISNSLGDPIHKIHCEWIIGAAQLELDRLEHEVSKNVGH